MGTISVLNSNSCVAYYSCWQPNSKPILYHSECNFPVLLFLPCKIIKTIRQPYSRIIYQVGLLLCVLCEINIPLKAHPSCESHRRETCILTKSQSTTLFWQMYFESSFGLLKRGGLQFSIATMLISLHLQFLRVTFYNWSFTTGVSSVV